MTQKAIRKEYQKLDKQMKALLETEKAIRAELARIQILCDHKAIPGDAASKWHSWQCPDCGKWFMSRD
jgi:predicted RNA-binding Zn-ribbon protein involved in translation (DUF1610 family)